MVGQDQFRSTPLWNPFCRRDVGDCGLELSEMQQFVLSEYTLDELFFCNCRLMQGRTRLMQKACLD